MGHQYWQQHSTALQQETGMFQFKRLKQEVYFKEKVSYNILWQSLYLAGNCCQNCCWTLEVLYLLNSSFEEWLILEALDVFQLSSELVETYWLFGSSRHLNSGVVIFLTPWDHLWNNSPTTWTLRRRWSQCIGQSLYSCGFSPVSQNWWCL